MTDYYQEQQQKAVRRKALPSSGAYGPHGAGTYMTGSASAGFSEEALAAGCRRLCERSYGYM